TNLRIQSDDYFSIGYRFLVNYCMGSPHVRIRYESFLRFCIYLYNIVDCDSVCCKSVQLDYYYLERYYTDERSYVILYRDGINIFHRMSYGYHLRSQWFGYERSRYLFSSSALLLSN